MWYDLGQGLGVVPEIFQKKGMRRSRRGKQNDAFIRHFVSENNPKSSPMGGGRERVG